MPLSRRTGIPALDANTIDLDDRLKALETSSAARERILTGVELPDGVDVDIRHGLGRTPVGYEVIDLVDAVTTGRIQRSTSAVDRTTFLRLQANGWGATLTVSLRVY